MDNDNCAIMGSYTTFKHIKTRKVVVLEVEVAEEYFEEVISKLGMPIGGESKPVAIALLNHTDIHTSITPKNTYEQTEGEKLRTRAVLLCKDLEFQSYVNTFIPSTVGSLPSEIESAWYLKSILNIKSRSELATNLDAQQKFKELLTKFDIWKLENQYKDNLDRI